MLLILQISLVIVMVTYWAVKAIVKTVRRDQKIARKTEALKPLIPVVSGTVFPDLELEAGILNGTFDGVLVTAMNKSEGGWNEWVVGLSYPPGGETWVIEPVNTPARFSAKVSGQIGLLYPSGNESNEIRPVGSAYIFPPNVPGLQRLLSPATAFRGNLPYINRKENGTILYTVTVDTDTTVPTPEEFAGQLNLLAEIERLRQQGAQVGSSTVA